MTNSSFSASLSLANSVLSALLCVANFVLSALLCVAVWGSTARASLTGSSLSTKVGVGVSFASATALPLGGAGRGVFPPRWYSPTPSATTMAAATPHHHRNGMTFRRTDVGASPICSETDSQSPSGGVCSCPSSFFLICSVQSCFMASVLRVPLFFWPAVVWRGRTARPMSILLCPAVGLSVGATCPRIRRGSPPCGSRRAVR